MKRDFLKDLGIEDTVIDKILDENSKDIGRFKEKAEILQADNSDLKGQLEARDKDLEELKTAASGAEGMQKQLAEMQEKYTKDTEALNAQLADRAYSDAVSREISENKISFSSKSAEKAFIADLMANRLTIKDGALEGFKEHHEKQLSADPAAFAGDKPAPFVKQMGAGQPAETENKFASMARLWNGQTLAQKKE